MSATPEEVTVDAVQESVSTLVEFAEKPPNAGKGRVKGVPNKNTVVMRDLARYLAEERAEAFLECFDRLMQKRPERAMNAYLKLLQMLAPRATTGFQVETATTTNERGENVMAMRLQSLLEAPLP